MPAPGHQPADRADRPGHRHARLGRKAHRPEIGTGYGQPPQPAPASGLAIAVALLAGPVNSGSFVTAVIATAVIAAAAVVTAGPVAQPYFLITGPAQPV
jgi:hypothetical protein